MECIDEKRDGIATGHAATTGSDLLGGPAAERASGRCPELGLLADVAMTSGDDRRTYPILEIAYASGMWWSMPPELSQPIYDQYALGKDVSYIWAWGNKRSG